MAPSIFTEITWQERLFVSIAEEGGSDLDFESRTNEVGVYGDGAKEVEGDPLMNGGRLTEFSAQGDFTMEMTIYKSGVSADQQSGLASIFHGSTDNFDEETGKFEYETSLVRPKCRVAMLWTDDSNVSSAVDSVASGNRAYRVIATGARLTSYTPNFDDQTLKAEVTFTIPPFDVQNNARLREQEMTANSSSKLAALEEYTA